MKYKGSLMSAVLLACASLVASPALPEDLAVVGSWSSLPLH